MNTLRTIGLLTSLFILSAAAASAQNINVTATGGTPNATYPTVKAAFDAVNAGTHTGAITMDVVASTTEPASASAVLNGSGAGAASYTSVLIRPTADGVMISGTGGNGSQCGGKGLIELNGADNVTIDGDNPNTPGVNRNLTLTNTCGNSQTSVIRIALATSVVNTAHNNTFKNLVINGSVQGGNDSGVTDAGGAAGNTYGIFAGGGASTSNAENPPSMMTSAVSIGGAATANNLTVDNNRITNAARGVSVVGSAVTVFPGLLISNNLIGNPTAGAPDGIYTFGITANGTTGGVIRDNTIYVESYLGTAVRGIDLGAGGGGTVNTGSSIVERNQVKRVKGNNPQGQIARGINVNTNFGQTIRNNFVSGVINSASGLFTQFTSGSGINIDRGPSHSIYNNTVYMSGNVSGTDPHLTAALAFASAAGNNSDIRNNILINTQTQNSAANPAGSAYVSIFFPTTTPNSSRNWTFNNNDYFQGTAINNGIAQAGQTAGTGFYTAANFDPNTTTPATNLRAFTSQLTISGANDNASTVANPQLVSNTDLHLQPASPMVNAGVDVLVFNDIDSQIRVNTPDIGADEADGVAPQQNDIAALSINNPANGAVIGTNVNFAPAASFANYGTATQSSVTVRFQIIDSMNTTVYNQTAAIGPMAQFQVAAVNFPVTALSNAGNYTTRITAELGGDQVPANNIKNGTLTVLAPVSGTVNVGAGQSYTTLTNADGLFAAINTAGATGNIIVNITSDITTENGAVKLNQLPTGVTLTIKPSGGPRRVAGSVPINTALIALNGADNVTIDGSLNGGTDRSLTFDMLNGVAIIYLASGTNGAQNNTIKNLNLVSSFAFGSFGIFSGGNTLPSNGTDNDNNRFQNNDIQGTNYGIATTGQNAANKNTGTVITQNVMTASGTNRIKGTAIFAGYEDGVQITQNTISGVGLGGSEAIGISAGIQIFTSNTTTGLDVTNALIANNTIGSVQFMDTLSSAGIAVAGGTSGTNTIVNNTISGVLSNSTGSRFGAGIFLLTQAGGTQNVYYNSVSMTGDRGPEPYPNEGISGSFGLVINGGDNPVNLRNNIFYNTQTSSSQHPFTRTYVIGIGYSTFANLTSDNNVLFSSGPQSKFALTGALRNDNANAAEHTSLAAFRTATGTDANSLALDPKFVSTTDLHIQTGVPTPVENRGTPIAGITVDFDGETRNSATPDIGADEGNFTPLVPNDIAATVIVRPVPGELVIGGPGSDISPVAVFTNNGSNTQTNVMVQFTITGPGGYNYSNTFSIASITAGTSMSVLFNTAPPLTTAGTYTATATNLFSDSNTANDSISATFPVLLPLSGSYDVGEGGSYTSLTNAGGIFEALNIQGASGNVVINITSDLTNETALVSLRDLPGDATLTIKPSGGPRIISGGRAWGLIRLRGADNVTIDGSLNGGTDRSLTIINNQPLGSQQVNAAVIMIANDDTGGAFDGASNNTIKNCVIMGNNELLTEGIVAGDIILGLPAQQPNNNNTIKNNLITRVHNGIFILGNAEGGTLDDNWVVEGNTIGSEVPEEKSSFRGMLIANAKNFTVTRNTISGVFGQPLSAPSATAMVVGMQISGSIDNGQITRNAIKDVRHPQFDAFGSFGANGIYITANSTTSNLSIANNMVSAVSAHGSAFTGPFDNGYGIFVQSGGGYNFYHNTVSMNTDQTNPDSITAAINVGQNVSVAARGNGSDGKTFNLEGLHLSDDPKRSRDGSEKTPAANKTAATEPSVGSIDLRGNIFSNTQTVGTRYAIYVSSFSGASVFSAINYNDYFAQNVGFLNAPQPTLANWQTATGQDANSKAVDPLFASVTDLHLRRNSLLINAGTPIPGITVDFDGQNRGAAPDIGADEFAPVALADYDGDGKTDIGVWRGATGEWFILNSGSGAYSTYTWGASGDQIVPGDYDGDGNADVAVFRPSTGLWAILNSSSGTYSTYTWGAATDVPIQGDYDNDGKADVAVWRPSTGEWIILKSSGGTQTYTWGAAGDVPLSGDFDGDGQTDLAVWRPLTGEWFINRSTAGYVTVTWGVSTDRVVHADYDGDGKSDVAVWRPSTGEWSILRSSDGGYTTATWGASGDVPVPGDYDGDGRADIAVFRNGTWHISQSTAGYRTATWGTGADTAIPSKYLP